MPYASLKQIFLLLATTALLFGLTPVIHAEGLSGLKDSLNKGKINKNETNEVPAVQPNIVSEPAVSKAPAKTNRITDANTGKTKFNFVDKKRSDSKAKPLKSKKDAAKEFNEELKKNNDKILVTLKQARKKKKALPRIAAVRIGDNPENDASIPAKLPEDFLINVDTDELTVRKEISDLYNSFEATSLEDFNKACQVLHIKYYQTRPDICYLIRLIKTDAQLKKDPNSALEDQTYRKLRWPTSFEPIPYPSYNPSMYEEYLKMGRDTECGNDIIKFVNQKAKIRQSQIKKANDDLLVYIRNEINVLNKLKADYEAYVKELLSLKHILPGSTSNYENGTLNLQNVMRYAIDDIKAHYSKISQRYLIIAIYLNSAGQWKESLNLTKEFKDYFEKNCPYKFTIKLAGKFDYDAAASSGNLGNLKIIEKDLLIDKDNLKWGPKRIDQAALECMSRLSLQNVSDVEGSIQFKDEIINFAESNILDQEEIKEYKKEVTITKIYFTENEFYNSQVEDKIFAADERICVRYESNDYNRFYQKPIEIKFKSSISKREKTVIIYKSGVYSPAHAVFQPNEVATSNDKIKNLIKKHGIGDDELRHSICLADGYIQFMQENSDMSEPDNIYKRIIKSEYFKDTLLGVGVTRKLAADKIDMVQVNKDLFDNMGFEVIYAQNNNKLYSKMYIQNQANWFIFDGHSSSMTYGGEVFTSLVRKNSLEDYDPIARIFPNKMKYQKTNLNFLVLLCCYVVSNNLNILNTKIPSSIVWRKKIGDDVAIIGYNNEITGIVSHTALSNLISLLENEFYNSAYTIQFKDIIIIHWLNLNKKIYIDALNKWFNSEKNIRLHTGAISASAILGKYYYHILPDEGSSKIMYNTLETYNDFIIYQEDMSEFLKN